MILKKLLESVAFKILTATSGPESIETFKANDLDVVVMDLWMTGMNGITAAQELKEIDPAVRVVFLSA